ncbi:hypothetical protein EVJ22_11325 [Exiguobacterium sp. SH0S7]|uniref:hypothetical protein n=1 Tax=Exiguobacterium sp. SH0S7 TaxID=2510951 RepID=UPI00103AD3E7|nr:hypothetical protein [Exiguobacterium sp. SH0S7]TCI69055.1 hypothetical protein EVJ22_11325 [Exiguobacterium sp. SH0S7]
MDILILAVLLGVVGFIVTRSYTLYPSSFEERSLIQPNASHTTKCPHCQTVVRRQEHGQTCTNCHKSF